METQNLQYFSSISVDFVSGPFVNEKLHLYEGYENELTFFRSALRSLLVHHIVINLDANARSATAAGETVNTNKEGSL